MNSIGDLFRVVTFGESHGNALGCVVDGCPAGVVIDEDSVNAQLHRRRPGQSKTASDRKESDKMEILSGVFEGKSLGTPIAAIIRNEDQRSTDYDGIRRNPRPGHGDLTWEAKFGHIDFRGGGRASGRETVARVIAGGIAENVLIHFLPDLQIVAYVSKIGSLNMKPDKLFHEWSRDQVDEFPCRCPDESVAEDMEDMLIKAKSEGESYGGVITLRVAGMPMGLGEPVFSKLQNYLVSAFTSVGTVNGIWWNTRPLDIKGSEFHAEGNSYGGINGGISNGGDLLFHIACKPVSTIGAESKKGRHDPCILPRAVPVMESMASIVLADLLLLQRARKLS